MAGNAQAVEIHPQEFARCVLAVRLVTGDAGDLLPLFQGESLRCEAGDRANGVVFAEACRMAL